MTLSGTNDSWSGQSLKGKLFRVMIRHHSVSFVTVEDFRVGLWLRTMQLSVFIYAFLQIMYQKKYMTIETPTGLANSWPENFNTDLSPEELFYCGNSSYDFDYGYGWLYKNNSCRPFQLGEVVGKLTEGGLYIQSYIQESVIEKTQCSLGNVTCTESSVVSSNNFFTPGIENLNIAVSHAMSTSTRSVRNVETLLLGPGDQVLKNFSAGEPIMLAFSEILKAAGIESLEQRNDDAYVDVSTGHAAFRMTGAALIYEFDYTNQHTFSGDEIRATLRIKNARTGFAGTGPGSDMLKYQFSDDGHEWSERLVDKYSYGFKLMARYTGKIGTPSFSATVFNLVTYTVLFTLAGLSADIVALYCTPKTVSEPFRSKRWVRSETAQVLPMPL